VTDSLDAAVDAGYAFARGLSYYLAATAAELGIGLESSTIDPGSPASAYLALDGELARFPGRELALLWDERYGWAATVETHSGEDLIVLTYLGGDLLPAPAAVARFVAAVRAGDHSVGRPDLPPAPTPEALADLSTRLYAYSFGLPA
jgi:hypothetical protein